MPLFFASSKLTITLPDEGHMKEGVSDEFSPETTEGEGVARGVGVDGVDAVAAVVAVVATAPTPVPAAPVAVALTAPLEELPAWVDVVVAEVVGFDAVDELATLGGGAAGVGLF